MTKIATIPARIHLTLDEEDFEELKAIAEEMKQPGNPAPKPQAVIRIIIAEYIAQRKPQAA